MDGHLTMGMLVAFQALMLAFLAPINRMVTLGGQLQEVRGDMNRLDDVLRASVDQGAAEPVAPAGRGAGRLRPAPPRDWRAGSSCAT